MKELEYLLHLKGILIQIEKVILLKTSSKVHLRSNIFRHAFALSNICTKGTHCKNMFLILNRRRM